METTFLLHGGRLKYLDERNDAYFRRLTRDLTDGDSLLHIPFARASKSEQDEVFEREKQFILAQTDKSIDVVRADQRQLAAQIKQAKSIHITGGDAQRLVGMALAIPNFETLLAGKTVGGSSAGACMFATKYWLGVQNRTCNGLGTLPIALFVHAGSSEFNATDAELRRFQAETSDLELIALKEAQWTDYLYRHE